MKRVWRYTSQSLARRSLLFGMKLNREDTACRFLLPCTLSRAIRFMRKEGKILVANKLNCIGAGVCLSGVKR